MRHPGGTGRGAVAAGDRGTGPGPAAAGQALTRRPAGSRPELPLPRPAQRGAGGGGARAVAGQVRCGPDGTWLSRIADPGASRRMRRRGTRPEDIPGIPVRVIEYTVTSEDGSETSETFTLVTDIPDPGVLSMGQAAAAYASRWQLETCFDELETSLRGGATVVLRSKSPPMIRQEI